MDIHARKLSPEQARANILRDTHHLHFVLVSEQSLRFSREVARRNHLGLPSDSETVRIYLAVQDYRRSKQT